LEATPPLIVSGPESLSRSSASSPTEIEGPAERYLIES
jgi:hypothetical protein